MELTLSLGAYRAAVSPYGASLRRYFCVEPDGSERDILWGYSGNSGKKGGQGDVLLPFPGRIRNGRYHFEGQSYQLELNDKDSPSAIHGFARKSEWEIKAQSNESAEFRWILKEDAFQGYPFRLETKIAYSLTPSGLECRYWVRNTGASAAPVGIGFHPYFVVGTESADQAELQLPAQSIIEFAPDLLPTGRIVQVEESELDFRKFRSIGALKLNHCFGELNRDADGLARTRLRNPRSRRELTVWMDSSFGYVVVYTGDTIPQPYARKAVAIEPMTCATDAFNHPGWGTLALAPGQSCSGRYGIEE